MLSRNNAFFISFKAVQQSAKNGNINPNLRYKGRTALEGQLSAIVVNAMRIAEENKLDLAGAIVDRVS